MSRFDYVEAAYNRGYDDYIDGVNRNPYRCRSDESDAWDWGWADAEADVEEEYLTARYMRAMFMLVD